MNKKAFIKSVREWEADAVASALAKEPALANYVDQIGKTPLHHCAGINPREANLSVKKSIETARALIAAGSDINAVRIIIDDGEEFQATSLWYAIAWGKNLDLARFLLEKGASPDHNSVRSAIWDQDLRMAELLVSFGANIDPVIHNETPLLQLVKSKRLQHLKWLIDHGANINFQDQTGYSALHYAVTKNYNRAQIQELLRSGAKPTQKSKNGDSPISLARKLRKVRLVELLEG
ncbi:MAG: ankyrin repeat domain-containing protein [Pyrinomonadaceae bacterium]|nr:ankyrin repeat domain-containing protein [Pyrinomonadaceae bacterium]